jgi:hypothetical protein
MLSNNEKTNFQMKRETDPVGTIRTIWNRLILTSIINLMLDMNFVCHINDYSVAYRYPRDVQTLFEGHTMLIERHLHTLLHLEPFSLTVLNRMSLLNCLFGYIRFTMTKAKKVCNLPWVLCDDFNPTSMRRKFDDCGKIRERLSITIWCNVFFVQTVCMPEVLATYQKAEMALSISVYFFQKPCEM